MNEVRLDGRNCASKQCLHAKARQGLFNHRARPRPQVEPNRVRLLDNDDADMCILAEIFA